MTRFKFYKQLDQMDCGPTCLKMIARHYGKIYSTEFFRDRSAISNQGVTLFGLSKAAENIGFRTLSARVPLEKLSKLILPFIAFWEGRHFVVVYKITSKYIYVADPAIGKVKYSYEDFLKGWATKEYKREGKVLILETSPAFYKDNINQQKKDASTIDSILHFLAYLQPHKGLIFQVFLGIIVGMMIQLLLPFLSQAMIDKGINGNNIQLVYLILVAQILLTVGSVFSGFIRSWIFLYLGTSINISIITDFLIKVLNLPINFFDTRSVGDLLQRIQDNKRIESFLTGSFLNILFSLLSLVVFGGILYYYSPLIFTVFLIGSTVHVVWILFFQNIRKKLDYKIFDLRSRNTSTLVEMFDGIQDIKLSNSESKKRWDWEKLQAGLYKSKKKLLVANQVQSSGSLLVNQVKNIVISFLAAKSVIDGEITLGMMVSIQFIISQANAPVNQFVSFIRSFQMAEISFRRLNDVYSKKNDVNIDENYITMMPPSREIILHDVSFSYSRKEENAVLKNINITIPEGKITAIVGESGSGKTTILKMLLKFYNPFKGKITVGGVVFNNINPNWWNEVCGAVLQDSFIFSDTIARNITLGSDNVDKNKLIEAAAMANIQDFVESLPFGYNTKIGKGGSGLSQGQKQRILIARVIYKRPDVILLDEATNALDSENESEILDKMKLYLKGKTTVIVAHRLSTVQDADNIIVMSNGEVVESGTHEELLSNKGKYHSLVQKQLR